MDDEAVRVSVGLRLGAKLRDRKRMAMLYRSLALNRETCVFPPASQEKPLQIAKLFLVYVITFVRPTNTPTLVEIG